MNEGGGVCARDGWECELQQGESLRVREERVCVSESERGGGRERADQIN